MKKVETMQAFWEDEYYVGWFDVEVLEVGPNAMCKVVYIDWPEWGEYTIHFKELMKKEIQTDLSEETLLEARDKKIVTKKLQLEDPANVPANLIDYLNDTTESEATPVSKEAPAIPTPVIAKASGDKVAEEEAAVNLQPPTEQVPEDLLDGEQGKVTVADLVEKAEEEKESEEVKEKNGEAADGEAEEEEVAPPVESEEAPLTQDSKMKKTPVKAADLAEDWNEEGEEENGEKPEKAVEKVAEEKSEKTAEAEVDTTPVRKSGRAPKPTEKLLEGKQQEKMKPVEDEEESVDAIAAELEKSDPEVKKAGVKSPKKGSAKKGPKKEGEKEEDWVSLIFGENGEKVTEDWVSLIF